MLPTGNFKRSAAAFFGFLPQAVLGNEFADNGNCAGGRFLAEDLLGYVRCGGKQQLEVLAIAKSMLERGGMSVYSAFLLGEASCIASDGYFVCVDQRTAIARSGKSRGVECQSIADVDSSVQYELLVNLNRFFYSRCEVKHVAQDTATERSRNEKPIADLSARTRE